MGRLIEALRETGQLEDTLIFVIFRQWAAHGDLARLGLHAVPLRQRLDLGGRRARSRPDVWPGMIDAGRQSDGLFDFNDILPTAAGACRRDRRLPDDRYIDGVDQSSFLLAPDGLSNRKYHYYWLTTDFLGLCAAASTRWC